MKRMKLFLLRIKTTRPDVMSKGDIMAFTNDSKVRSKTERGGTKVKS